MQLLKLNLGSKFVQDEIIKNQSNYLITIFHTFNFPSKSQALLGNCLLSKKQWVLRIRCVTKRLDTTNDQRSSKM